MSTPGSVVVVGATLAGATAALTLRERGFDGDIVLVGAETELPYERPALSKSYLARDVPLDKLLVRPADAYEQHRITLLLGHAAIRARRRPANAAPGLRRGPAVHAPGHRHRREQSPAAHPGIAWTACSRSAQSPTPTRYGRSCPPCGRPSSSSATGSSAEITVTLTTLGVAVTAVDAAPGPLSGPLGPQLSALVHRWHTERGARLINHLGVSAFIPDAAGRVRAVECADGQRIDTDLVVVVVVVVVVGVGVRRATGWLHDTLVHLVRGAIGVDG